MTTVNVNVTDTSGQAWANGTISAQLQTAFGSHLNVPAVTANLDGSGNATITLVPNLAITPPGSGWYITACPAATAPCYAKNYTITGSVQNLNIVPPAIKINLESTRAITLPIHATAYSSSEIAGAQIGCIYYDLTLQQLMVLESLPNNWQPVGGNLSVYATVAFVENLVANPPEIDSVDGIPVYGIPLIVFSQNGQQQGTFSLPLSPLSGPGSLSGLFRVSYYIVVTTPSGTDTLQTSLTYLDESGSNTITFPAAPINASANAKISETAIVELASGDITFNIASHDGTAIYNLYVINEFVF